MISTRMQCLLRTVKWRAAVCPVYRTATHANLGGGYSSPFFWRAFLSFTFSPVTVGVWCLASASVLPGFMLRARFSMFLSLFRLRVHTRASSEAHGSPDTLFRLVLAKGVRNTPARTHIRLLVLCVRSGRILLSETPTCVADARCDSERSKLARTRAAARTSHVFSSPRLSRAVWREPKELLFVRGFSACLLSSQRGCCLCYVLQGVSLREHGPLSPPLFHVNDFSLTPYLCCMPVPRRPLFAPLPGA